MGNGRSLRMRMRSVLLLALWAALALEAAAAPNTHPNAKDWALEAGVGYPGHDIRPCGPKSKEACKADCLSDTKCIGFFFGSSSKQCCLKFKKGNKSVEAGDFFTKPKPNAEAPKPKTHAPQQVFKHEAYF